MTTPSGMRLGALQYFGAARGAVDQRASTAEFYEALRGAGATFGTGPGALSFREVNQLRSSAAGLRNAAERFERAPDSNALDATQIGVTPYGRSLADQAAMPRYHVGINLTTITAEGEEVTDYRIVQFTGQLPATKADLLAQIGNDAEALAEAYGTEYGGHSITEILAV